MFNMRDKMLWLKELRGLTWEEWGEKCNRAADSLKKLSGADSNPTVSTLDSVLPAVDASLEIVTAEQREWLDKMDVINERLKYYEQLCEIQRARIETFDAETENHTAHEKELMQTIKHQQEVIDTYIQRMYSREQAIDRKDARIVELSKRLGIW